VAALVLSHWILDAVAHRPDMPVLPWGGPLVGMGLWNSMAATLLVEGVLLAAGVAIYGRATEARDRTGAYGLWALVVFLVGVYAASVFGPPPPSVEAVAFTALAMWLLVAWAYWVDRHRSSRAG
jgi:hypothetical protein